MRLHSLLSMCALTCATLSLGCASAGGTTLTVDHLARTARVIGDTTRYRDTDILRVPSGPITVRLGRTSSALYACAVAVKAAPDAQLDTLRSFLSLLTPYASDVGSVVGHLGKFAAPLIALKGPALRPATERNRLVLVHLDDVLTGTSGVRSVREHALATLDSMSEALAQPIDGAAGAALFAANFRDWLHRSGFATDGAPRLAQPYIKLVQQLTPSAVREDSIATEEELSHLSDASPKPKSKARSKAPPNTASKADVLKQELAIETRVLKSADSVLANSDAVLAAIYSTEALSSALHDNSDVLACDGAPNLGTQDGRELDIAITAKKAVEFSRLADRNDYTLTLTAMPKRTVTPLIGIALVGVRHARFDTRIAAKSDTGGFYVAANGSDDHRALAAVTLGAKLAVGPDWYFVLPNIYIAPSSDTRAAGIGLAAGWRAVSVGLGAAWVRHTEYPQPLNTPLSDAALLQTRAGYGRPLAMYSIAIQGWPTGLGGSK